MNADLERIVDLLGLLVIVLGCCGIFTSLLGFVTLPAPSPNADGFLTSGALLFYTLLCAFSLGVTGVGVWLMSVYGAWNPLGFSPSQERVLSVAGGCFGLSLPAGVAVFFIRVDVAAGVLTTLVLLALGTLVVGATTLWRGGTAVRGWIG